ncbi:hypothetical protein MTR_7g084805 [Medicago truncatula]|uniref:Uncharacterized protein n=1 Tax=Medicago truncatula TaxID=3880 RepID=A0A072UCD6_MEDTR|nr:hypothetical protein MTR_7g084805 [Medicago truncatula]
MTAVRSSERRSDDGGGLKLSAAAVVVQRKGKERRVVNKIRFNLAMWEFSDIRFREFQTHSSYSESGAVESAKIMFPIAVITHPILRYRLSSKPGLIHEKRENNRKHDRTYTFVNCRSREIAVCSNSATQHCYSVASSQIFVIDSVSTT